MFFLWTNLRAVAGTTLNRCPPLYTAVDYDDNGTPASMAVVLNYGNVKFHTPCTDRMISVAFKPHASDGMYNGTNFTNYGNVASPWIDAASSDVLHFGVKVGMPSYNTISSLQVLIAQTVEFKNVR